ncbi:transposase [Gloeothece verrucosa]|uniref:Transposase IS4 family protein n=1 Tax=Gloeothece verrucosa (strain PCC 7822) TaxID=497965 RepID=E0UM61_GLOV7|nr:transposase [Gloeothece verrucosa]ADN18041.1 transposase IS4 family protein [Gloeothece verrucosa PCC 7822]
MVLSQVFERFVEASPVSVMVRGLLEKVLCPQKLDDLFERSTTTQYTRELLFSTVVEMMSSVACGIRPSIHAAYQAKVSNISVSVTSVYNKLNAMEPSVSAELVRETACEMEAIIRHLNGNLSDWLTGYRVKILDGNAIAASEHRLKPLRSCNSAQLPGQSLVVLDPVLMLAIDVFPTEDGHAQERSLLHKVLTTVEEDDVWIADRNFCTLNFLSGIVAQKGFFIIREHQCFPWYNEKALSYIGLVEGGEVFEQAITVSDDNGYLSTLRRIKVVLEEATRDGSDEIFILTNLPVTEVNALLVAQLYRKRWTLETLFQILTVIFNCEIKALGYPKAALFAFCVALVSYNILAVVLAALKSVHGSEKIEQEISSYYLAEEVRGIYQGMMIAIPPPEWNVFKQMSLIELTNELRHLAALINFSAFIRHPRSPKKTRRRFKRTPPPKRPHVSTGKILAKIQAKKRTP